jgi:hypothetical protein
MHTLHVEMLRQFYASYDRCGMECLVMQFIRMIINLQSKKLIFR